MKIKPFLKKVIPLLLISSFLLTLFPWPSLAIGPGTGGSKIRVDDQRVGPYILLVATSPLPATTEQPLSVWVRVTDDGTDQVRRDAIVMVEATARRKKLTLTEQATHKNAGNAFDYVAHFDITEPGPWDIIVTVEDSPGNVDVSFSENVSQGSSSTLLIMLGIPFILLTFGLGIYFWRRSGNE